MKEDKSVMGFIGWFFTEFPFTHKFRMMVPLLIILNNVLMIMRW